MREAAEFLKAEMGNLPNPYRPFRPTSVYDRRWVFDQQMLQQAARFRCERV